MTIFYKEIPKNMDCEQVEDVEDMDESSNDSDEEESSSENEDEENENTESKVYLPGEPLESGEELVVDKTAYRMLHHAQSGAPCLSFDVILDDLGNNREDYPLTMYMIAGTQAAKAHVNNLLVMKMKNLHRTNEDSDDELEDNESDDEDNKSPVMSTVSIKHQGCINRVRYAKIGQTPLAASWSELGRVHIWNLEEQLRILDNKELLRAYGKRKNERSDSDTKPLYTFKGHLSEGYGLDWCPTELGTLASGDCNGNIHIWRIDDNNGSTTWHVDQRPYNSHAPHSVEDLQWSPNERHVLASCSVDKSIKIWDTRATPQSACMLTAAGVHTEDINVLSWNRKENQFLVSGGDDGLICVWDLRQFGTSTHPLAMFKQHTAPVTTIEWHPQEPSVFASGGAPQLLFIHQGQTDIKELHWHPQCPGVIISTAHSGFNIFRTISV